MLTMKTVPLEPAISQEEIDRLDLVYDCQDYPDHDVLELDEFDLLDTESHLGDPTMEGLSQEIASRPQLKRLFFSNIIYSFKRLAQALSRDNFLLELRLSGCKIISQECMELAQSPALSQLRYLDLSCNPLKLAGLMHLFKRGRSVLGNLKRVDLFYCSVAASQFEQLSED